MAHVPLKDNLELQRTISKAIDRTSAE